MSPSRQFCEQQIARLSVLRGFPAHREGFTELVRTLEDATVSDPHAEAVVKEIIDTCEFSPSPAGIRRTALDLAPRFGVASPPKAGCSRCYSTGYQYPEYLITDDRNPERGESKKTFERLTDEQSRARCGKLGHNQDVNSFAVPCVCPLGQYRRMLDKRRQALKEVESDTSSRRRPRSG